MQTGVFQLKIKTFSTQSKFNKKRIPLASIKHNQRNSQTNKFQSNLKRTSSFIKPPNKIPCDEANKKTVQLISYFSKLPVRDKHLITAQMKCFMMAKHHHESHLVDQRLSMNAIQKIKNSYKTQQSYDFNLGRFVTFAETIIKKCGDTQILTSQFEACLKQKYPPSIQMMFIYLGVFLYSVNSQYQNAENYCQKLFDMIVKYKVQEFFIIYLLLKIKLKTNLSQWEQSLSYLTKLVFFSWMYSIADLQIWCYFQLSRVHFFLQNNKQSQIFRIKSQTNSIQPKRSIYRQVSVSNLFMEIQAIWQGQLDFNYNSIIDYGRLVIPEYAKYGVQQYISDQRKLKASIKNIVQDCKIRYVSNLLNRIGQISLNHIQKQNSESGYGVNTCYDSLKGFTKSNSSTNLNSNASSSKIPSSPKSGNNFLLTHKSHNKNMSMFFRKRLNQQSNKKIVFYTIENSQKNWSVLKQMLRNILNQMIFFSAPTTS